MVEEVVVHTDRVACCETALKQVNDTLFTDRPWMVLVFRETPDGAVVLERTTCNFPRNKLVIAGQLLIQDLKREASNLSVSHPLPVASHILNSLKKRKKTDEKTAPANPVLVEESGSDGSPEDGVSPGIAVEAASEGDGGIIQESGIGEEIPESPEGASRLTGEEVDGRDQQSGRSESEALPDVGGVSGECEDRE